MTNRKPKCYIYEFGVLFTGETVEECEAQREAYLNPKPYEKPQPKKIGKRK